jgi:hypothetical protein
MRLHAEGKIPTRYYVEVSYERYRTVPIQEAWPMIA